MPISRRVRASIALALTAAAVAAAVQFGAQGVATGDTGASTRIAYSQSDSSSMPPILPRESRAQLAAREAWEAVEFYSDPAPTAHYSDAEMDAYGTVAK